MQRPVSALSEKDDGTDALMQEEFERLQHQLRTVQNERQKQSNQTNVKLRKYRYELGLLNKENEELKTWLQLLNSHQNRRKDSKVIDELKRILDERDYIQDRIEDCENQNQKYDNEIKKLEKVICEKQQERCDQTKKEKERGELMNKLEEKILTMERNLQTKTNKFCETLKENEKLRADIDNRKIARQQFIDLHKKLSEQLSKINKLKAEVTREATLAFDHRQEAIDRKTALKERNEKDRITFEMEIKNLQRTIDHNKQLEQFMETKSNERAEWKRDAEERNRREGASGETAQKQRKLQLNQFKEVDEKLHRITQVDDVEAMIRVYKKNEDENFAQFKYVSELNIQIENLYESIKKIKNDIKACKKEKSAQERSKHLAMRELEHRMNEDKTVADADELQLAEIRKVLDQVKSQVNSLVKKLGCDVSKIVELMEGDGHHVTERNLVHYLSALEQRVDELLCIRSYTLTKGSPVSEELDQHLDILDWAEPQSVPKRQLGPLPSLTDVEDGQDDDSTSGSTVRPLTYAELIDRVKNALQKHEISHSVQFHRPELEVRE